MGSTLAGEIQCFMNVLRESEWVLTVTQEVLHGRVAFDQRDQYL